MLTLKRLRSLLSYDPTTGGFYWNESRGCKKAGDRAGNICANGHRYIRIDRTLYLASRLAWFYETREWPVRQLDHADCDQSNDRWNNLRLATPSENSCNTPGRSNIASGMKGVYRNGSRWMSRVKKEGRDYYLGNFTTKEAARDAYNVKAAELHGEFHRASR